MAESTGEFKHESLQDVPAVVQYLKAVTRGLEDGSLRLAIDDRELLLEPHGMVRFRLEAKRGKDRARLVLKLAWRDGTDADTARSALQITPNHS